MPESVLIDSHAHIDYDLFDPDRTEILERAFASGIDLILNICLGPERDKFERSLAMSSLDSRIFSAIGIHPHDADRVHEQTFSDLRDLCAGDARIVCIGEIGLDYYYDHSDRQRQREVFSSMLDLAIELKKPVAIHTRNAFDDTFSMLREKDAFSRVGGIIHCFSATKAEAEAYLSLGAYISFSGIVTFKKAQAVQDAARVVPLDRLLIETDCPYLAPEPHRGKRNEPAFVKHVAEALAAIHGTTRSVIGEHANKNLRRLLFKEQF